MTDYEFKIGLKRLTAMYRKKEGDKVVDDEQAAIMFSQLKGYPARTWEKAVEKLMRSERYMPRLSQMVAALDDTNWVKDEKKKARALENLQPVSPEQHTQGMARLRQITAAVASGDRGALDALSAQFAHEIPNDPNACPCNEGLVSYERVIGGIRYARWGRCMRYCGSPKDIPAGSPDVDPVTGQVMA